MKNKRRRVAASALLFLTLISTLTGAAYADTTRQMTVTYEVTENMLASPAPAATAKPAAPKSTSAPNPSAPPKTGDEFNMVLYSLIAGGCLIGGLTVLWYFNNRCRKKENS